MADLKDSNGAGPVAAGRGDDRGAAKKRWLSGLGLEGKNHMVFELESLLKGLDRFFNIANLPIANMEQVIAINFVEEMEIVLQFIERVVDLSGSLLDASRRAEFQFKSYVGDRLMGDYERSRWRDMVLEQVTPEESLFVLYTTFLNLREITRGLVQLKKISYTVFFNIGSLIGREMALNRYFGPDRQVEFRPEYDRVQNARISVVVRAIGDHDLQRQVSIVVLALNRLLQYLRFVDPKADSIDALKSTLLFFALINSEAGYLMEFMEKNLPALMSKNTDPRAQSFLSTCDSLAFQLQMELKKIRAGELLNLAKKQELESVRIAVENSHGILANFFQQSIIQILREFKPDLAGEEIFPFHLDRKRESIEIREDFAVLRALMDKFEEITETTEAGAKLETYLDYLSLQKRMIEIMREQTCPKMRRQDLVEFEKYLKFIEELTLDDLHVVEKLDKFKMESKFFKILVETTLGHIDQRVDLQGIGLDQVRVKQRLQAFVAPLLDAEAAMLFF